jgi:CRISPR system Cascade subunit CasE
MNWLARLDVDAETARAEDISDNYAWHKRLWEGCFPDDPNAKRDFLTRIDQLEGAFRLWVLSKRKPVRPEWCSPDSFALKEIALSFLSHRYYAFDLRVNPVKTIVQRGPNGETLMQPNGKRKNGKRIPLVNSEELHAWIVRKSIAGGFSIVEDKTLEISPMMESYFRKKDRKSGKDQSAYHGGVSFRGTLEVTDPEKFVETYLSGIGSAKGFGFGLLLLAPFNL